MIHGTKASMRDMKYKVERMMKVMRFSKAVVKYRIPILILALVLMVPSLLGMAGTRINYDMLGEEDHLTEETLKTLEEMGYTIDPGCIYSRLEAIMYMEDGTLHGCGDPRDDSKALGY